jgi:O-antigen/teichoic acid export membrane protein
MSLFRDATSTLSTSIAVAVIGLGTSVVITRWLSVDDRGLYSVATNFAGLLALVLNLGWPTASIYRLRRVGAPPAQVASTALLSVVVLSAVGLLAASPFAPQIAHRFLVGAPTLILYLAVAVVPFPLAVNNFTSLARGIDRVDLSNGARLAMGIGTLLFACVALIVVRGGVEAALIAHIAAFAAVAVGLLTSVFRLTGITARIQLAEIRGSARFGLKSYAQSLAGQAHERIDIILLALLLRDPAQVAFYTIAAAVMQRMKLVPESIAITILPRLASISPEEGARTTSMACRHAIAGVSVAALGCLVVGPLAIPLVFGEPYRASIPAFLILVPSIVFLTIYRVLARYFTAIDRQQINITSQLVSLVTNVGLNFVLIPRYGIAGAAFASLVSYGLEMTLIVAAFRTATGSRLRDFLVPRRRDLDPYLRRLAALRRRGGRDG